MSPYVPTSLIRAQSDERLSRLAALGSERAFEALVQRYRQPLLAYARRLVGESRAEDVVQASFVAAWTDLRRGSEIREVRAWLYRVVHNRSLNVLKRSDNTEMPLLDVVHASGPGVAAEVEDRDAIRATLREIADLPERQRVALLAVAVDGRRHRDVGDELGLSEGAVKMLVSRARGTLRAAAGALVPWPLLLRIGGLGGSGGSSAGAGFGTLGAGALKAGAVLATAGALATAGPPALHAISTRTAAPAATASATVPARAITTAAVLPSLPGTATLPATTRRSAKPAVQRGAAPAPASIAAPASPADIAGAPQDPAGAPTGAAPAVQYSGSDSAVPGHDFLTPASKAPLDGDIIEVVEDPPDIAKGEQAIPADGVSDAIADSVPGDVTPAADDNQPAPDAATTDDPTSATDPGTTPSAAPADTSATP